MTLWWARIPRGVGGHNLGRFNPLCSHHAFSRLPILKRLCPGIAHNHRKTQTRAACLAWYLNRPVPTVTTKKPTFRAHGPWIKQRGRLADKLSWNHNMGRTHPRAATAIRDVGSLPLPVAKRCSPRPFCHLSSPPHFRTFCPSRFFGASHLLKPPSWA